jgi:hypothetical protein
MGETKAHLDDGIRESLNACWLSYLLLVAEAKLAKVVCSEGVDGSRSSQEAAEVWATCDACNVVDLILQRLDNFEWGVNRLKLALDLAALSLSVGAPRI